MCLAKSGIAIYVDEQTVKVYTLPGDDSHEQIREHFHLSDRGELSRFATPLECIPITGIGANEADYELVFDDCCPTWWTDQMSADAKACLVQAFVNELADGAYKEFSLNLRRLTSLPDNCTLTPGGGLDLPSLTSLPEGCTLAPGGYLDLCSLTVLPEGCTLAPGGELYLSKNIAATLLARIKTMFSGTIEFC